MKARVAKKIFKKGMWEITCSSSKKRTYSGVQIDKATKIIARTLESSMWSLKVVFNFK